MNIKQIRVALLIPALVLVASVFSVFSSVETASALSDAEKKACFEKWAGAYVGASGDGKKLSTAEFNEYTKSKCSEGRDGSCKVKQYEDGKSIVCQRKDGQYAGNESTWTSTAGGDNGETGDDGVDSGSPTTNPIAGSDCAGVKTAIIKCDADNSGEEVNNNGIWALLMMVLNIMTAGIGILAVGGIVYGAILYTTAEDKADQVKKATGIITNVVIGLILYAFMWAGLNFIVPGGIFA